MYISRIEITKPAYSSKVQEITMILEESSIREFIILQSVIQSIIIYFIVFTFRLDNPWLVLIHIFPSWSFNIP